MPVFLISSIHHRTDICKMFLELLFLPFVITTNHFGFLFPKFRILVFASKCRPLFPPLIIGAPTYASKAFFSGILTKKRERGRKLFRPLSSLYLRSFTVNLQEAVVSRHGSTKYSVEFMLHLSCHEALAICRQSLSAIMAINSLFVGFPRVLWMV